MTTLQGNNHFFFSTRHQPSSSSSSTSPISPTSPSPESPASPTSEHPSEASGEAPDDIVDPDAADASPPIPSNARDSTSPLPHDFSTRQSLNSINLISGFTKHTFGPRKEENRLKRTIESFTFNIDKMARKVLPTRQYDLRPIPAHRQDTGNTITSTSGARPLASACQMETAASSGSMSCLPSGSLASSGRSSNESKPSSSRPTSRNGRRTTGGLRPVRVNSKMYKNLDRDRASSSTQVNYIPALSSGPGCHPVITQEPLADSASVGAAMLAHCTQSQPGGPQLRISIHGTTPLALDIPPSSGAAARASAAEHKRSVRYRTAIFQEAGRFGNARHVANCGDVVSQHSLSKDWDQSRCGVRVKLRFDSTTSLEELDMSRKDPVDVLPPELSHMIFGYLSIGDLCATELVNRSWNQIASTSVVWRDVFLSKFSPEHDPNNSYLQMGGMGLGASKRTPQEWKRMTKARTQIGLNWKQASPRAIYFSGHTDSVYCCQFDEEKIITGSRDRTIRVWDLITFRCIKVIANSEAKPVLPVENTRLDEHTNVVRSVPSLNGTTEGDKIFHCPRESHSASILCLQFDKEIMVTGSSDTTCIVWDIKTWEPIRRLSRHQAGVLDICFDQRYIISCSKDHTICVWSRRTGDLLKILQGHRGPVNAVQMRGDFLVSASGDGISRMWNLRNFTLHKSYVSRDRGLAAVEFSDDGKYVLAGGNDQVVYKFDAVSSNLEHTFRGHTGLVRSLFLDYHNRRVISGSYDQGMRVYDFNSGAEIGVYNNWTTSWILAAKADYRRIVATSQDGRVLVMDFGYHVPDADLLKGTTTPSPAYFGSQLIG